MAVASTSTTANLTRPWRAIQFISAGLLGMGVPLLVSGPSTEAVVLGLAIILVLVTPARGALLINLAETLKSPIGLTLMAVLVAWIPSVALSLSPLQSLAIWGRSIGLLIAASLIACFLARNSGARDIATKALVLGALVCATLALIGLAGGSPVLALIRGLPFESFEVVHFLKYYASVAACLMPVVLVLGHKLGGAWWRAAWLYPPMALSIVLLLNSGAGVVGLVAAAATGGLAYFSGTPRLRRFSLGGLALLIGLGLVGLGSMFAHAPAPPPADLIVDGRYEGSFETPLPLWLLDAHRQQIWGFSLDATLNRPWFGYGLDRSNYIPGADLMLTEFNQTIVPAHPHNWLIEIIIDSGFIGLAALLGVVGAIIARWLQIARQDRWLGAAGLGLCGAFFTSSLLNFSFWTTWWQTVFLVLSAILMAHVPRRLGAAPANPDRRV
ncbi:MAG: O-antigen ligase family protein [Alphaproteobacteria bacterium]|nr:O-antigen ligase family protein [Alphaproteobacteria bacterium]